MSDAQEFDYVIAGAGSAGCVLANRLSEDEGVSVCLLEAGPPDKSWHIHVPLAVIWAMVNPKINWMFNSKAQKTAGGREIFMPRGKTLGGSSSINGMVYIRGNPGDYDEWADAGNAGWSWKDVRPYFLKSENNEQFAGDGHHESGGPLNVTFVTDPNPAVDKFVAAAESLQYRHNKDFNGETQEGFGLHQVTQKAGRRWSTARAFLEPAKGRENLTIRTDAPVEKVIMENGHAVGIKLLSGEIISARREVILSAGALTTPKIMLQSGIGDGAELQALGIEPHHNLPGVGRNLQDHASIHAIVKTKSRVPTGFSVQALPKLAWSVVDYLFRRRGMWASNMVEGGGFVRTKPELTRPDIQYVFTPGYRARPPKLIAYGHGYAMTTVLLRPKSRGRVTLAGTDATQAPVIDPHFFEDEEDMETLLRGLKESRRIFNSDAFAGYGPTEIMPGKDTVSDDDLRAYILENSATIFHPVGTCKMGAGDDAVVDARLRVHGIDGLRIVDGSIMPTIVGGNTNAPIIMIAEKASDMIKEDRSA
ncbi:MAG: GMC family oxidoreductase N-terminal domain-containing protein [Rhodospirillales bacterium]|nr:GMC family oxidoreductase N-terminal domain-containing protein [Rhodospirillales bacterium]